MNTEELSLHFVYSIVVAGWFNIAFSLRDVSQKVFFQADLFFKLALDSIQDILEVESSGFVRNQLESHLIQIDLRIGPNRLLEIELD